MIAALTLAAVMIGGIAMSAQAQDKPCCPQGGQKCKIADLTADQQTKIDELKTAMMKDMLSYKNQIAEKKAHLKTLAMADQADMTAINKTVDELYALKAELAKKKEAHIQEVRKVLTPEQRLQFDMMHAKMGHGNGDGCGQQGQGCQKSGAGCQQQGQGCQKSGAGCQQQGQGCQKSGAGCQQQGQGCQDKAGTGQGCQHQQGSGDGKGCQGSGSGSGKGCQGSGSGKGCQHQTGDDKK